MSDASVVHLLESILVGPYANQLTREYVLTALMKLSSRLTDSAVQETIKGLLHKYTISTEVEIQQRAVEYTQLFAFDNIRPAVLERMPVPEGRAILETSGNGPTSPGENQGSAPTFFLILGTDNIVLASDRERTLKGRT